MESVDNLIDNLELENMYDRDKMHTFQSDHNDLE